MTAPAHTLPARTSDMPAPESSPVVPAPSSLLPLHVKETRSNNDCKKVSFLSNIQNAFLLGLHGFVKNVYYDSVFPTGVYILKEVRIVRMCSVQPFFSFGAASESKIFQ